MTVVVGGQCRKAGKTTAVCDIIAATVDANWIAWKISPHTHDPGLSADPDTERYLRAGAAESELLTAVPEHFPKHRNIIIESNQPVPADLVIFIRSEDPDAEWKESAHAASARTSIEATARLAPEALTQIARQINERRS